MKRIPLIIAALLLSVQLFGQVVRQVEVTKQYAPKLPPARKLDIATNRVDTVSIRPEIDYTIQPKSFASVLTTDKFRPATVTYWQYDKQYPFYLKAGIGVPLTSEVDAYGSTHRANVGYISAYVNHRGNFADIKVKDAFDSEKIYKNNSQSMTNRVGVNGGKYVGRYTFDGDIYYESDIYHRYPMADVEASQSEVNFENVALALSFGDSFADLSKLNFSIYGSADFYNDKSIQLVDRKLQQISATAGGKIARRLGSKAEGSFSADYSGYYGLKGLNSYGNSIISAALSFDYQFEQMLDLKVGVKYSFDKFRGVDNRNRHHFLPYLYLGFNLKNRGNFVPYFELDSKLVNNSYQQLQRLNPYIMIPVEGYSILPNSAYYNLRLGIAGRTTSCKFAYRIYANIAFVTDALYWYSVDNGLFEPLAARENVWSVSASLEYKPISTLLLRAEASGMAYTNFTDKQNGKPSFQAELAARYTHRKFAIGASASLVGGTKWSVAHSVEGEREWQTVSYPAYVDVTLNFDWFISKQWTLYVEGRNLANANIYPWAYYRQYGIGAVVGFKVQF